MENENRPPEKKELPDLSLDGPKGVGGWLAFLIIILTILSPVANIAMLAKDFHEIEMETPIMLHISAYVQYKWFCWGAVIVASVISIAAGCLLWKKHEWKSVRYTISALWLIGPFSIVLVGLYFYMSFGTDMIGGFIKDMSGPFTKSILWAVVWTAYLLKSKRVSNTYIRQSV